MHEPLVAPPLLSQIGRVVATVQSVSAEQARHLPPEQTGWFGRSVSHCVLVMQATQASLTQSGALAVVHSGDVLHSTH